MRSFVFAGGTIANTHFVAIPFNAAHREGAMVVAEFLLSPEAQARKQDVAIWGDPTVLRPRRPRAGDRARFDGAALGPATLPPDALGRHCPSRTRRGWCCSSGAGPSDTAD